jgi:prepilin-type N-terminal cleavage/methylation domain-containing protein
MTYLKRPANQHTEQSARHKFCINTFIKNLDHFSHFHGRRFWIMLKRLFKAEGGFTLVELLVTIAILAVLFGIVTLTLTGVGSGAEATVCDAEFGVVQSAIDIYMAEDTSNSITAQAAAGTITGGSGEFTDYLQGETLGTYTWDADGANLVQDACPGP